MCSAQNPELAKKTNEYRVTFPDGTLKTFAHGTTPLDIANGISPSLAKKCVVALIDGKEWDLNRALEQDCKLELITRDHELALEIIRHDTAHILAQAVQELFPNTQVTIGPNVEHGFYYDFARKEPFSTEDFEKIEKRMRQIIEQDLPLKREVWDKDEAIAYFEKIGEKYKAEIIRDLPAGEPISVYRQGDTWLDLCRGPHMPNTKRIGTSFKLMKVAGAYWRGDSNNEMLQRIYGTAWRNDDELKAHLHMLEEAEKRDHRKLGRDMDLFHMQEEAVGSVFWHDKGYRIWLTIEHYIRTQLKKHGYVEVKTPQLLDRVLWEKSGHWDKFGQNMFTVEADDGQKTLGVKPMNCPGHVQIFRQGIKSYRDLPLRMAEFGCCHRNEPSGAMHGIMRVRQFTQDDAHIFCTEAQITPESIKFCRLVEEVYKDFGFESIDVKLSTRPEIRAGEDHVWDKAEKGLADAVTAAGLEFETLPGEGAFYGPKLEFHLTDAIGRKWQCGTLQLDFVLPERLEAQYTAEDGSRQRPVMLHRAILGSIERFIGILIENFAGHFPLWLAPVQVVIATITDEANDYAQKVAQEMERCGMRVSLDLRNEKINYKIREHSLKKVPVIAVIGAKEAEQQTLALRRLGSQEQSFMPLQEALTKLSEEAKSPLDKR